MSWFTDESSKVDNKAEFKKEYYRVFHLLQELHKATPTNEDIIRYISMERMNYE